MVNWLARVFKKKKDNNDSQGKGPVHLPENLLLAIQNCNIERIFPLLREWCETVKTDVEAGGAALSSILSEQKWDRRLTDKLEIAYKFHVGKGVQALEKANPYLSGDLFDADLFVLCLIVLFQNNQLDDAYGLLRHGDTFRKILDNRSDYWLARAMICWSMNEMEEVRIAAKQMFDLSPDSREVLETACMMFVELGDENAFQTAREKFEALYEPSLAYGLALLAMGDYEKGLRGMEARYRMDEVDRYINSALGDFPRWTGENLGGKRLLVTAEQGLGDTIQMARYLPVLAEMENGGILMETHPLTLSLLEHNFPQIQFLERKYGEAAQEHFDFWIGTMSLPYFFGATVHNIPSKSGYLKIPRENSGYWQDRISKLGLSARPRIGLAWSGQPLHRGDRRRSIPFEKLMLFIRRAKADFFALQTQVPATNPANLIDVSEEMLTLADTAALIDEMDLVITVDTSVVHVAGAIGKQTWLLLPYRYEWRWGLEGESNAWYDSVRVLRQQHHGDWDGLLDVVFNQKLPEFMALDGRK